METQIDTDKNTCETDDKTQIKNQFMSSQTFYQITYGRIKKIND
jgi:hypothetical protein